MKGVRYILASGSPRRRELLAKILEQFEIVPSGTEEKEVSGKSPVDLAMDNAMEKALAVSKRHPDAQVIGADTVVVLGDVIMGKPKSKEEAIDMLTTLSGRTHQVITGVALVRGETQLKDFEISDVTFKDLDKATIEKYVEERKPLDKAGAYGIQEVMDSFVESLEGGFNNVVGLPTDLVEKMIDITNMSISK